MTFEIGFVLLVVILMMVGLVFELARPDMIVFVALTIFLLTGILTPDEALKGFSNEGMLTIALLFIIAGAIQKSGIVDQFTTKLLKESKSTSGTLLKTLVPVSSLSAFLNNTPIVVALTPIIRKWCADHGISPSKFLIPLSYATILGGTITLLGTSTNLVVHGLMLDFGMEGFSMFQLGIVGVPSAIIGLLYIVTVGYKLLPDHKILTDTVNEQSREYLSEVRVEADFPYINQSIEKAGLRKLKGLYLIEIIRNKEKISPVRSSTKIQQGDRLIFTGLISTIAELQQMKGLRVAAGTDLNLDMLKNGNTKLVEAVVSHQSSLLYKKIRDTGFRSRFDAGVIAVHRNSERIKSKIGEITLKSGDSLLLLAGPDFQKRMAQSNDFYVVTALDTPVCLEDTRKGWIALGALLSMILLVTLNVLTMFKAMSLAVVILLLTRVLTPEEAKRSVQFNILLLIASSFGVGMALLKTGAAEWIANGLVKVGQPFGIIAMLFIIYLITNLFTEIITNSAAAVMMFPIGLEIANQLNIDPTGIAVMIAIAASSSFVTPIGYQTNLIVYGPGGYKFTDYFKIGIPLSLIVMTITVFIVNLVWIS
ncbi:SLC13 family permease [Bacillus taeanensis]|uniref:SLC13 family permease n=1 Tax=Bacillus taeanensis TaxID=273032 RepID=A0A366XTK7_9BACI|nr:SLC13 family permease [Bacillus taeanensis]RBW68878.1 SLC13 family permease [Bacillus taeanensis]